MEGSVAINIHFRRIVFAMAAAYILVGSVADVQSAFRKLAAIETGAVPRGSRVSFTQPEIDAWMVAEAHSHVPQGISGIRLELSPGRVVGYADIDFLKIRQATSGGDPGWLIRN